MVTFQTTQRGVEKLHASGVRAEGRFALRLLANATHSKDASTNRGGIESEKAKGLFPAYPVTG